MPFRIGNTDNSFLRIVAQLDLCLDASFKSLGSTLVLGFGQISIFCFIVKPHVTAENHQINNSIQSILYQMVGTLSRQHILLLEF